MSDHTILFVFLSLASMLFVLFFYFHRVLALLDAEYRLERLLDRREFEPKTGDIRCITHNNLPHGWLWCDGSIVNASKHLDLHNLLGERFDPTGFGAVRLPDLRSRTLTGAMTPTPPIATIPFVPAPVADGNGTALPRYQLGQYHGEVTHVITLQQMPSHNHGGTTGNESTDHSHTTAHSMRKLPHGGDSLQRQVLVPAPSNPGEASGSFLGFIFPPSPPPPTTTTTSGGASQHHSHAIPADGGGSAVSLVQPSLAVNWIIKT